MALKDMPLQTYDPFKWLAFVEGAEVNGFLSGKERGFVRSIRTQKERYGEDFRLSDKQHAWLEGLARREEIRQQAVARARRDA